MRNLAIVFSIAALFVSRGSGQSPDKGDQRDRTFYLTHTDATVQFMQVANAIHTITDIEKINADNAQKSITVHASPGQIAMSEWLFNELDSPAKPAAPREYRAPGSGDDVALVFYLTSAPTVQDFQEVATLIRTISDTKRAFTINEPKALVLRGTDAQIALSEWLVQELQPEPTTSTHQYQMPGNDDFVRVLRLPHKASVQDFQKAVVQIREATQIKRVFTYNNLRAVALRGTADQIARAERLAAQLDKP